MWYVKAVLLLLAQMIQPIEDGRVFVLSLNKRYKKFEQDFRGRSSFCRVYSRKEIELENGSDA